jgi:cytosine/adenosine deaminase-related metal-dependent hydrolase
MLESARRLIRAAAIADGSAIAARPGALLIEANIVLAAGPTESIGQVANAEIIDATGELVIPALVNAHSHLDLTHIGPQPFNSSVVDWLTMVRQRRASDVETIRDSVHRGAELALAGGTGLIGDIAGSASAVEALRDSPLAGVSYLEFFGLAGRQPLAIERMRTIVEQVPRVDRRVRLGLQPHAPYSCGLDVYRAAAASGLPLATHLAESLEELEFVSNACGPIAAMIRQIGVWDDTIHGCLQHPIDLLAGALPHRAMVAAHVNYLDDAQLLRLATTAISVAYCPRASSYFGHPHGQPQSHRYRDMLAAGINVALGTDSIVCLDTPDRISVLDDMRLLSRRDAVAPRTLLRMATEAGAAALGYDPAVATLAPPRGRGVGVIALPIDPADPTDALLQTLRRDDSPRWLLQPHSELF